MLFPLSQTQPLHIEAMPNPEGGQSVLLIRHIEAKPIENGIQIPLESGIALAAHLIQVFAMNQETADSFVGHTESPAAIEALRKLVSSYDDWKASQAN